MLSTADLELLTAAIDGELTVRQERRFTQLLESSVEARSTYARLKRDAAAVKNLPQRSCPVDLSASVLDRIARLPQQAPHRRPILPRREPTPGGVPTWFAFAMAASVLFVIGLASFLYFEASRPHDPLGNPNNDSGLAHKDPVKTPEPEPRVPTPEPEPKVPPEVKPPVLVQNPPTPEPEKDPMPAPERELLGPIFTGPSGERIELRTIEPTAATLHKIQGLDRAKLAADLGKASTFRLELPCKDAGKAIERMLPVLKGQNLIATVDSIARGRLDKPQWKSSYLLVLDDMTPADVAALVEALAEADRKVDPKKPNEPVTPMLPGRFVLSRANKLDLQDLRDHLGTELPMLPAGRTDGPLGVDPTRPLADQTADEIDRRLAGGKPSRPALLLAYGMPRVATPSVEAKKFLDSRKPARPGSVQVMLVLRQVG